MIGSGGSMFNLNSKSVSMGLGCSLSAYNVIFSGGYTSGLGVIRTSGGTSYFSSCTFAGNSCTGNGLFIQQHNSASLILEDCIISGNSTTGNIAVLYHINNGYTRLTSCTITENKGVRYPVFYHINGGTFEVYDCTFTSNIMTIEANLCHMTGTSAYFENCVFSANSSLQATHRGRVFYISYTNTFVNCQIEQIVSSPMAGIYVAAQGQCTFSGGAYDTVQNLGSTTIIGNVSMTYLSSGTVNITSGASIALTSNISATAINVEGAIVVNGASVAAGTYTKIDSTGTAT